jgi:cob(I)alamin adenosyltransferase
LAVPACAGAADARAIRDSRLKRRVVGLRTVDVRESPEAPVPERRGTVQVYTGDGKGKTTAALGLALRAVGHGLSVYMLQFMKGSSNYGELTSAAKLRGFIIEQSGRDEFVDKKNPAQVDIDLAAQGLEKARAAVAGGDYDIVILDEINVAVDFGLISIEDVLSLIETRPPHVELVLTGRSAHPNVVRAADLVSEVLNIKHHYDAGVEAREGIEF